MASFRLLCASSWVLPNTATGRSSAMPLKTPCSSHILHKTGISTTISEDFFFLRKATTTSPFNQPALVVYAASERFRHFARRPRNQPIAGLLQTAPRGSAEIRGCSSLLRPMHLAAVSRRIDHRRPVTEVALGAYCKYRRCVAFHMFSTNVGGGKQRDKLRRGSSFFDVGATARFLALHQAQYTGDLESQLTRRLNGLDGRTSRGAHVIHDHHARQL